MTHVHSTPTVGGATETPAPAATSSTRRAHRAGPTARSAGGGRVDVTDELPTPPAMGADLLDSEEPDGRVSPPLRRILVVVDACCLLGGWLVAVLFALPHADVPLQELAASTVLTVGLGILLLSAAGLYRRRICAIRSREVARIGLATLATAAAAFIILLMVVGVGDAALGAGGAALAWLPLLTVERGILREWIQSRRAQGDFSAPVLVVAGNAAAMNRANTFITNHAVLGFDVRGVVGPRPDDPRLRELWRGELDGVAARALENGAAGIVLDARSLEDDEINDVVEDVTRAGLHVHMSTGLHGIDRRRMMTTSMADEIFLHVAPVALTREQVIAKRIMDVVIASLAFVVLAPVLLLACLAVWLEDRGPIFFRQKRVGHGGELFTLYKLRTLVPAADRRRRDIDSQNGRQGPLFKVSRDPRVTSVGRILRATSIDELPQLLNVLEGTMSLVGPRPALPDEVEQFDEELQSRAEVKPGLTGLWQVEARDLPSFELYRRYDLMYVRNWSIGGDLSLLGRTAVVVVLRSVSALWRRGRPGDAADVRD